MFNLIRPICPECDGEGGRMSGYYQPEWSECGLCNPDGTVDEPVARVWFWQVWRWRYHLWRMDRRIMSEMDREAKEFEREAVRSGEQR